ncbi:hypothetical protein FALCPG4_018695 [Fusarium falciforme]
MLDSDNDSDAVPNSAGPAPPAKALSTKTLDQLQYKACLTDDVLHFLSTAVFARHRGLHPPGARVHLKDPLWFDAAAPLSLPRFLFQDPATGLGMVGIILSSISEKPGIYF